jgi:hypothetical protein
MKEESYEKNDQGVIIRWRKGDFLGAGNFAQVFRAINLATGNIFAVKRFNILG